MSNSISYSFEDEDGINPTCKPLDLEFTLEYNYSPGEPMVMYYADGSGYPGSPPEIEIYKASCENDFNPATLKQLSDWFLKYLDDSPNVRERIEDRICEDMEEARYSYDEDKYDDREFDNRERNYDFD